MMVELSNTQWMVVASSLAISFTFGGWLNRKYFSSNNRFQRLNKLNSARKSIARLPKPESEIDQENQLRGSESDYNLEEMELILVELDKSLEELASNTLTNQRLEQKITELQNNPALKEELSTVKQQLKLRETELKDIKQESEVILVELHKAQEELASNTLLNQKLEQKITELQINPVLKEELSTVKQQLKLRETELKDSKQESEVILVELHKAQEELASNTLLNQKLEQKITELQKNSELKEELIDVKQQLKLRNKELKDIKGESESILLRLQKSYEEQERYLVEKNNRVKSLENIQEVVKAHAEQFRRINTRLLKLFISMDSPEAKRSDHALIKQLENIVMHQNNALNRFKNLQK